jgi:hypothetical protein
LFTNVTLSPTLMVTLDGLRVPLAIVIVAPLGPGLPDTGDGPVPPPLELPPPPHANAVAKADATAN